MGLKLNLSPRLTLIKSRMLERPLCSTRFMVLLRLSYEVIIRNRVYIMDLLQTKSQSYLKIFAYSLLSIFFLYFCFHLLNTWLNVPFWDEINDTAIVAQSYFNHTLTLKYLLHFHGGGEHRALLQRVVYLADYIFFSGVRLPLLVLMMIVQLALFCVYASFFKKTVGKNSKTYLLLLIYTGALLLSPKLGMSPMWPLVMGQQFTTFFFVVAIFMIVEGVVQDKPMYLGLGFVFGLLSTLTLANGLLVWPSAVLLLLFMRSKVKYIVFFAIAGAVITALYLHNINLSSDTSVHVSLYSRALFFLCFIGSIFSNGATKPALYIGSAGTALYLCFGLYILFARISDGDREKLMPWLFIGCVSITQ